MFTEVKLAIVDEDALANGRPQRFAKKFLIERSMIYVLFNIGAESLSYWRKRFGDATPKTGKHQFSMGIEIAHHMKMDATFDPLIDGKSFPHIHNGIAVTY